MSSCCPKTQALQAWPAVEVETFLPLCCVSWGFPYETWRLERIYRANLPSTAPTVSWLKPPSVTKQTRRSRKSRNSHLHAVKYHMKHSVSVDCYDCYPCRQSKLVELDPNSVSRWKSGYSIVTFYNMVGVSPSHTDSSQYLKIFSKANCLSDYNRIFLSGHLLWLPL